MDINFNIQYSCGCAVGKIRKNNEDNFYCEGRYRTDPDNNDDIFFDGTINSSQNEMFAVFDGMGGEACGEIASFIAASNCYDFAKDKDSYKEYIYELSTVLNERVKEETSARNLVLMGTTAAMIQFYKDEIFILNVGDSKIFKLNNTKLAQISHDHTVAGFGAKAPLTNFIGIPTDGFDPYIAKGSYKENDVFILCTDGVTDMIDNENLYSIIKTMLKDNKSLLDINKRIIEISKENGGYDNATLIICKICKP